MSSKIFDIFRKNVQQGEIAFIIGLQSARLVQDGGCFKHCCLTTCSLLENMLNIMGVPELLTKRNRYHPNRSLIRYSAKNAILPQRIEYVSLGSAAQVQDWQKFYSEMLLKISGVSKHGTYFEQVISAVYL